MGNHEPTYRVKGLSANGDLLLVNISDGTNAVGITENGELKVLVSGDISISDVSVDNVQLIDADGNKLLYTATGEIQVYAADGKIATLGSVDDTVTASSVIGLLKTLIAKDFATETTLATMATEAKLEAVRVLLNTISGLDFASETTLDAIKDTDGIKKITDKVSTIVADGDNTALGTTTDADTANTVIGILKALKGKDFATQTTLATLATETKAEAIRALLATISGIDFAEETTLSGMSGNVGTTSDTDSDTTVIGRLQKLITDLGTLADSKTLSDIITAIDYESGISATGAIGTITATTTASAAIAGGTALANRKGMEILNNSANVVYWGYTDAVTTATGMPINPGISKTFEFKPSVATAIYVIAASDSELYIHEWK